MKSICLTIVLLFILSSTANAQLKEAAQLATLSPTIVVVYSDIESYKKSHFTVSTIGYLGSYLILESKWKAALFTLMLGATKELIYDAAMGQGEPLWEDMKWNTLGVGQGLLFSVSLNF